VAEFDKVIRGGRMDCGFYQTFMGYALEGNREAHKFTLGDAYKDMRYVESMANAATVATPMANAVKTSFALAMVIGGSGAEGFMTYLSDYIAKANGLQNASTHRSLTVGRLPRYQTVLAATTIRAQQDFS
jgi:hypothetical protein